MAPPQVKMNHGFHIFIYCILKGMFLKLEASINMGLYGTVISACDHANTTLTKCTDGMDHIPRSFLPSLGQNIR